MPSSLWYSLKLQPHLGQGAWCKMCLLKLILMSWLPLSSLTDIVANVQWMYIWIIYWMTLNQPSLRLDFGQAGWVHFSCNYLSPFRMYILALLLDDLNHKIDIVHKPRALFLPIVIISKIHGSWRNRPRSAARVYTFLPPCQPDPPQPEPPQPCSVAHVPPWILNGWHSVFKTHSSREMTLGSEKMR